MDFSKIKVVAMDLDGTLSQHKSPLPEKNIEKQEEEYTPLIYGRNLNLKS